MDPTRLAATLGQPALARLLAALRRRLELGRALTGTLTLTRATPAERSALDDLLGRRPTSGSSVAVDLDALAASLATAGICRDLTAGVEALLGPVTNRAEAKARRDDAWNQLWNEARARPVFVSALSGWLEELRESGVLRRLVSDVPARGRELLNEMAQLLAALPGSAEPLPALAARWFGDAHALDPGTPRATLAVRAAARLGGVTFVDDAEGRRAAWAGVGVACDELSTPALIYQLRPGADTPLARLLRTAAESGNPLHVSLRLLLRHPLTGDPALRGCRVYACENPSLISLAAARLGTRCAPLVCVQGQFATPVLVLLRQLRESGCDIRYHGDFDPAGLAIARRVFAEAGARPWRFGAEDYREAGKGVPFPGEPGSTPWDPALSEAMRADGRGVHEESVHETLLRDLAGGMELAGDDRREQI